MSICTCTRLPQSLRSSSTTAEAKSVISAVVLQHVHAHVHAKQQHEEHVISLSGCKEAKWISCCSNAGRPLIMVSGQGATLGVWTPDLLKTLAAGRQVTIFDNLGIGYSADADPEEDNTVLGYADSTVDLTDALGLEQPDILGWSLGGFITLTLVTSFPEAVNRVVLADTSAGGQGNALLIGTFCVHQRLLM